MKPIYINLLFSLALIFAMIPLKDLPLGYFAPLAILEIFVFTVIGDSIVEKMKKKQAA